MEQKLQDLVDRLGKDINGMPWHDRGMTPNSLKTSVEFFIKAFQSDAKLIIKGEEDGKEA